MINNTDSSTWNYTTSRGVADESTDVVYDLSPKPACRS